MAVVPTLKVEISFVSDPLATAPTWVDVSAYVRQSPGVSIHRGRMSESSVFEAGSCRLTLSNRDRRFDPSYASGPYFGNLLPRKQIRVSATWSAVDYIMFQGWVTGWPQSQAPPAGLDSTVTIEAICGFAWLANNNLPNDLVYTYANTTIGSLALFLRQADTSRWSDATSAGYSATVSVGTGATSSSIARGSASTCLTFDGGTKWVLNNKWSVSGSPWSIAFWVQSSDPNSSVGYVGGTTVAAGDQDLSITRTLAGRMVFSAAAPSPVTWSAQSLPGFVNNSSPHFVCVTSDGTTAANTKVYIDGQDRTESASGSGPIGVLWVLGSPTFGSTLYFNGALQDVAAFTKQLSAAEVLGFYNYSRGYVEESSTTRVTRLLDDVGWPASWRNLTTTQRATVGELVYNASPALPKLQEVERTEQGYLFVSKDNKVTLLSRYYLAEDTTGKTSQQIFSDDGGATAVPYSTFGFRYDDLDVTNDVTITTPTTWAKASDASSITTYGLQSDKVDTILTKFTDADSMARGLVARGKTGTWRAAPIMAYPANNTSRWDEVLGLELVQRITIENTPMKVGSQNAQDVSIDGLEWIIENQSWSLIVAGSPVRDVWFVIDDAASLVDGTRVIGY